MAFVYFPLFSFPSCHGNCRSTFVPGKKKLISRKTTTTMSIQTVNHGMNCIKGLVGFCILRIVPWLSVQERILEFRLSPKMYDDDDEMELTQSAQTARTYVNKSDAADSSNIRMEKRRHKEKKKTIPALKEKEREDFTHTHKM